MERTHLRLRVDTRLLARLEKASGKNGRTLTGEILHRLELTFLRDNTLELVEEAALRGARKVIAELDEVTVVY